MKKSFLIGILTVVIIAVALGAGAYVMMSNNGNQVKTALNNMRSAKSYHADVTVGNVTFSGDYDFANNKSKGNMNSTDQNINFVLIGSDSYFSTDNGTSFSKDSGDATVMKMTSLPKDTLTSISDAVNAGSLLLNNAEPPSDNIGGTTCNHLSGQGKSGNSDVWVAADGSYVCQIKISGTAGGTKDYTIKITNFNAAVDIVAPTNVTGGN